IKLTSTGNLPGNPDPSTTLPTLTGQARLGWSGRPRSLVTAVTVRSGWQRWFADRHDLDHRAVVLMAPGPAPVWVCRARLDVLHDGGFINYRGEDSNGYGAVL